MSGRISAGRVKLYPGEPKRFFNDPDSGVWQDLDRRMTRAQLVARKRVRVRTGRLLSSIRKNRSLYRGVPAVSVIAGGRGINYTMYEHDGTSPHIIRVKRAKALRFTVGGNVVFRRQVFHPGTRGSHFLYPYALAAAGD